MQYLKWPKLIGFALAFLFCLNSCSKKNSGNDYSIEGNLKKWQPVTITFEGPKVSETDSINPFLDYSLITRFINGKDTIPIHGFFAADGEAAHTGAASGNKWQVKFSPPTSGSWTFETQMLRGNEIAIRADETNSTLWTTTGTFEIAAVDSLASGFYKTGRLHYTGEHYLRESETGKAFLKNGVGSPENFLAYHEFDGTFDNGGAATPTLNKGLHEYPTHRSDWKVGNPTWGNDRGKGIIGALNYMASKGMNSLYFLVMNEHGDGNDVWPWIAPKEQLRYDVSKMAQWEKVFTHMDGLGIAMNLFTQETENDTILNKGELGLERKLFYKELVARFGHHLGVVWNLGEETNRTSKQLKSYATYIRNLDPYNHPIAVHNHVRVTGKRMEDRPLDPIKETLTPMLGYGDFEIPSLQMFDTTEVHKEVRKWRDLSARKNRPWVVFLDEIGHWDIGVTTDTAANNNYAQVMRTSLWGTLMAGGAGTSWYFGGLDMPNNDMAAEDFRARNTWWDISSNAKKFFQDHLPFWEMQGHDELLSNPKAFCFAKKDEIYAVYLPKGETTELTLGDGAFSIAFYDPLEGGNLYDKQNEGWKITKPNNVELTAYNGQSNKDWVIVIARK
ncbi:DUF5060 domain-containing protein [Ulvibacterium sp.]|uniref:DUF5060 domain-containing protein n=1 Tax=Ulvibacterium sp. TaxID=2665914 RepID=UPI00261798E0|nr:DUF5060 domain-containing protein [Ulvibacterium sp.]